MTTLIMVIDGIRLILNNIYTKNDKNWNKFEWFQLVKLFIIYDDNVGKNYLLE